MVGELQGEVKELSFKEMSVEQVKSLAFSFKYYELLTGEIKFSDGFEPKKVSVTITQFKKGSKALQQQWVWREAVITSKLKIRL